jgi:hypothetical protein
MLASNSAGAEFDVHQNHLGKIIFQSGQRGFTIGVISDASKTRRAVNDDGQAFADLVFVFNNGNTSHQASSAFHTGVVRKKPQPRLPVWRAFTASSYIRSNRLLRNSIRLQIWIWICKKFFYIVVKSADEEER